MIDEMDLEDMPDRAPEWLNLNAAPRTGEFLADSRTWKRPQYVRRVTGGEFESCASRRKVIPQAWIDVGRLK